VYWTGQSFVVGAENGTNGTTRLFIGQYIAIEDKNGIPPSVSITQPQAGATVIEGSEVVVRADATDDVAVASVTFTLNGNPAFVDTSEPFEARIQAPGAGSPMVLGATASDFGGNSASAPTVAVTVVPDPLTEVVGIVVDRQDNPVSGAAVSVFDHNATSGADGSFTISGVPTVRGVISAQASATVDGRTLRGRSAPATPVPNGTTDVGTIRVTEGNVLILSDVDGPGVQALAAALTAAGNTVTVRPAPEYTWNATNPPLDGFNVVIHLNGFTWQTELPSSAQTALTQFVQNGGGFIGSQWNGYEVVQGRHQQMRDLILQTWATAQSENSGLSNRTYSVVPGKESHPVLIGVPATFSFTADGHSAGDLFTFSVSPPEVLMRVPSGGPAVVVREFGNGRVVNLSHAAGYEGQQQTLLNPNIQKLYINAVAWSASK
jgi:hypothetical protein